ncbi:MAG: ATP synthase F0 subunit C [Candidatus Gracilibacteria bacterium]
MVVETTSAVAGIASNLDAVRIVTTGMTISIGVVAPAIAEGWIASKAMEAMGRNPEAADSIFPKMIVAMALCESTAIFALVLSLIIFFVK